MTPEHCRVLADFHAWQADRLLDAAAQVPQKALMTERLNDGTVFEALWHVLDVNYSWRCALEGVPTDDPMRWQGKPLEDLSTLRAFWIEEDQRLSRIVGTWDDASLEGLVTPSWRTQPFKRWQVLMHIVTHQSDSAHAIGWALTRQGASPGEIAFMAYVNAHREEIGL